MNPRWKHRPEGSTWGDFGPDDQIGRLNLLTPEKVKQAAAEVREGLAFCLSLPLDYPGGNKLNPRRHPPRLDATYRDGKPFMNFPLRKLDAQATDVISDDQVTLCLQYSTQWDSLAHVGSWFDADGDGVPERVYYNGYRADEHVVGAVRYLGEVIEDPCGPHVGAKNLGVEHLAAEVHPGPRRDGRPARALRRCARRGRLRRPDARAGKGSRRRSSAATCSSSTPASAR